jgi:hypothetical protein
MPTNEYYLEQIERELAAGRSARAEGNDGKTRVCARRAAGRALSWLLERAPRAGWGADAMRQLQASASEPAFPAEVREAAARLSARITGNFAYPATADPLEDAGIIIRHVRAAVKGGHAGAS